MRVWGAFGAGPPLYTIDWIFLLLFFSLISDYIKRCRENIYLKRHHHHHHHHHHHCCCCCNRTHTHMNRASAGGYIIYVHVFMNNFFSSFSSLFFELLCDYFCVALTILWPSYPASLRLHGACTSLTMAHACASNKCCLGDGIIIIFQFSTRLWRLAGFYINHNSLSLSLSPVWALQCNVRLVFFPPSYDCILCCNGLSPHSAFILLLILFVCSPLLLLLQLKAIIYCRYEWGRVTDVTSF